MGKGIQVGITKRVKHKTLFGIFDWEVDTVPHANYVRIIYTFLPNTSSLLKRHLPTHQTIFRKIHYHLFWLYSSGSGLYFALFAGEFTRAESISCF